MNLIGFMFMFLRLVRTDAARFMIEGSGDNETAGGPCEPPVVKVIFSVTGQCLWPPLPLGPSFSPTPL